MKSSGSRNTHYQFTYFRYGNVVEYGEWDVYYASESCKNKMLECATVRSERNVFFLYLMTYDNVVILYTHAECECNLCELWLKILGRALYVARQYAT